MKTTAPTSAIALFFWQLRVTSKKLLRTLLRNARSQGCSPASEHDWTRLEVKQASFRDSNPVEIPWFYISICDKCHMIHSRVPAGVLDNKSVEIKVFYE